MITATPTILTVPPGKSLFHNNSSLFSKGVGVNFFIRKERALLIAMAVVAVCVSSVVAQGATGRGTFTDKRDGKTYKTVKFEGQTWMAENLNYHTSSGSCCYDNNNSNCDKYGRLYDWKTAKTACPSGWHLPSNDEWEDLVVEVGSSTAGKKLKSTSGWNENGNGTDEYGFSALPGGGHLTDGYFSNAGNYGYWWAATEGDASGAYRRSMYYNDDYVNELTDDKENGLSVRCVGD
jgi:uncharacterized protein (TIGR02145 family)